MRVSGSGSALYSPGIFLCRGAHGVPDSPVSIAGQCLGRVLPLDDAYLYCKIGLTPSIVPDVSFILLFCLVLFCFQRSESWEGCLTLNLESPKFPSRTQKSLQQYMMKADKPKYILGHALEINFVSIGLVAMFVLRWNYARINARRNREGNEKGHSLKEMSDMGDRAPTFRYML